MANIIRMIKPVHVEVEFDEVCLKCRLCVKVFASQMALFNHCKSEHTKYLEAGVNINTWNPAPKPVKKPIVPVEKPKPVDPHAEEKTKLDKLTPFKPEHLVRLVSGDISYILVKSENVKQSLDDKKNANKRSVGEKGNSSTNLDANDTSPEAKRRRTDGEVGSNKNNQIHSNPGHQKRSYTKAEKNPQPITGPFECLQPSGISEDKICHTIFFNCCEYSIHFRDEHTKRRNRQRCQVCEKLLNAQTDEACNLFTCQICLEPNDSYKSLQDHINTKHKKLRPFECLICHKRFTQQGGLMQHMRMHTGERPFPCTFCNKTFTQKSGLEQHTRTHTKVKPYRCVVCSKNFSQSIHLKQHMRIHTNVSPFQCGICSKRFRQSSHLHCHLKLHTETNMTEEEKLKLAALMSVARAARKRPVVELSSEEVVTDETVETEEMTEEVVEEEVYEEAVEECVISEEDGDIFIDTKDGLKWTVASVSEA